MLNIIKKLVLVVVVVFLGFTCKLVYEFTYSPLSNAMEHPSSLTVLYRPGCHRCKEVAPMLLPKLLFSTKRDYLVNADGLDKVQLRKIGLEITPGFVSHGVITQTTDMPRINKIWDETH